MADAGEVLPYCHVQKFWHKLRLQGADSRRSPPMAMDASEIERLIKAGIPDAKGTIRDLAGGRDHYAATGVLAAFKGKARGRPRPLCCDGDLCRVQGQDTGAAAPARLQRAQGTDG